MPATAELWRRYGHERLYVTAEDGAKLGYLDLKSDEARNVPPDRTDEFLAAVRTWKAANDGRPRRPPAPRPAPRPLGETTPASFTDLASNQPGESAAQVADAYREARPVRSLISRLLGEHTDERAWRVGAQGEAKTARQLRRLTNPGPFDRRSSGTWHVIHSVPLGQRGRDIDHLVLGPPGVFTINSKHHEALVTVTDGGVLVGKRRKRYAEIAEDEARRAAERLTTAFAEPVQVTALIAVVGAPTVVRGRPRGVVVLPVEEIVAWLLARTPLIGDAEVESLFEVARRSTTWQ
jgi:hypothetical protein